MRPTILFITALALMAGAAGAETINVPEDFETIGAAVEAAENGDIVLVAEGVYREIVNFSGKAITVASHFLTTGDPTYIAQTIINPNGQGRAAMFENGEGPQSRLIGFTLTGGAGRYGGGIYCLDADPTLDHLLIIHNEAERYGGGIYATRASRPTLTNCTIAANSAGTDRGAMHIFDGSTIIVSNCIIWGNQPVGLADGFEITYSDIQSGYAGQGNFDADPLFVNGDEDDYRLTADSPCIDGGDPDSDPDPDGTRVDVGAFFFRQYPNIRVEPAALDFGELNFGFESELTLTIWNIGAAVLTIESVSLEQGGEAFAIVNGGGEAAIAAGDEHRVTVGFNPPEEGDYQGELIIVSNDPEDGEIRVAISGTGLPPVPDVVWAPAQIDFGVSPLQRTNRLTFTLFNRGFADLNIDAMAISGDDAIQFNVDFENALHIEPGDSIEQMIEFKPTELGAAFAEISIRSDDPEDTLILIGLSGEGELPEPHFNPITNTGVNHSILILDAVIEGEPLANGGEIAVFSPNGLCCGGGFWLGEPLGFAAWGDNELTEEVDGFRAGEDIAFRIWDLVSNREMPAEAEYVRGGGEYEDNGVSVVNLTGIIDEEPGFWLFLEPAWNMISVPVEPGENDIVEMWRPLVQNDNLVMIKDHFGRFYRPDFGFNNIPFWDFHFGYQVKTNGEDSLWVAGEFAPMDEAIPLRNGWSIVAYYPDQEILAPTALENIRDVLVIAKDGAGRFYRPDFGFNNIPPMRRGQGYQVRVNEAVELVWNIPDQVESFNPMSFKPTVHFPPSPKPTGRDMSLLVRSERVMPVGTELAVKSAGGVLLATLNVDGNGPWGAAVRGDDPTTEPVDGALEGEALNLILYYGNDEIILNSSINYFTDEFALFDIPRISPAESFFLSEPSPNPFNSETRFNYNLTLGGLVRVDLYDVNGRWLKTMSEGTQLTGHHSTVLSGADLTSGLYLVKLSSPDGIRTVKAVLVK